MAKYRPGWYVESFFDEATSTASHVVYHPETRGAAIIDPVLDFDPVSARISFTNASSIAYFVLDNHLNVEWILETHIHADHISAAWWLKGRVGGSIGISSRVVQVQTAFRDLYDLGAEMPCDGSPFDHLFADGERFTIGSLDATALHVPGHTPADCAYVLDGAIFTGDTLLMPDCGSARADFPGGSARQLYRSIRRLLSYPKDTRLFLCHDYKTAARSQFKWQTTVAEQRTQNIHVRDGVDESSFVAMRNARDQTLALPRLMLPSIQLNIRAGALPQPAANGVRYLKIPLNAEVAKS